MTVFEKIIAREIPAHIIYEDDLVISFLDKAPTNKGHALIVPKKLFVNIFDADEAVAGHMMRVAKKIAHALVKTMDATGVNLVMNNGADASQEVFHAHLHVIPRHPNDGIFQTPKHTAYEEGEDGALAEKIKAAIV